MMQLSKKKKEKEKNSGFKRWLHLLLAQKSKFHLMAFEMQGQGQAPVHAAK